MRRSLYTVYSHAHSHSCIQSLIKPREDYIDYLFTRSNRHTSASAPASASASATHPAAALCSALLLSAPHATLHYAAQSSAHSSHATRRAAPPSSYSTPDPQLFSPPLLSSSLRPFPLDSTRLDSAIRSDPLRSYPLPVSYRPNRTEAKRCDAIRVTCDRFDCELQVLIHLFRVLLGARRRDACGEVEQFFLELYIRLLNMKGAPPLRYSPSRPVQSALQIHSTEQMRRERTSFAP